MFFKSRSIKNRPKNLNFARFFPSLVLVLGLLLSYQLWTQANEAAEKELQQKFNFQVQEVELLIKQRLLAYTQVLYGTRGLYAASDSVNRDEFKQYVNNLQLEMFYPGILGVGYAVLIPVQLKEQHLSKIRQQGFPNYKIYPVGEREEFYTSVIYIEPFAERNLRAFGYDMYLESVRRKAMQRARDNNTAAMSGKITLVQETEQDIQAGFIIYLPQFRREANISTRDERRSQIIGWHYTVFRMNDLMHGILGNSFKDLDINIYDSAISKDTLMYDEHGTKYKQAEPHFKSIKHIEIAGHIWLLDMSSHPNLETQLDLRRSELIAMAGISGSLMMSWIIWLLVSGRKRALQAAQKMTVELSERETRYRQMFEDNSCASVLIHPQTFNIIAANLAASIFWGYSQEQLSSMKMSQINSMAPKKIHTHFNNTLKGSQQIQTQHRLKSGELREVELYAGPITYQGETVIYEIFHDITARVRAEKALQESTARWEFAIEGSGDGVWDWDVSTGDVIFSRRLLEMLGYKEDEINAHISEWQKRIHPDDKPKVEANLANYFAGKTSSYISEYRLLCKDGSWKWILDRGVIVRHNEQGHALRVVGTHTDISLQKETETVLREAKNSAIQANTAKSEFIANMSHEIRTPMNAILGFSSILSDVITDPMQQHYLNAIETSGKTLLQLINDILDLSKIEAGKLELQFTPVSIKSICEDISIVFSQKLKDKGLDFIIDIADDLPAYLLLDETRLRQVLLNLVGNAVKFTSEGFVRLTVNIKQNKTSSTLHLMIAISDSGIGIAKDQQQTIFSAFTQQKLQDISYGGTGLGLTICTRLLKLMKGKIDISSELGKGSCFTVHLETTEALQQLSIINEQPKQQLYNVQFFPAKILVVDDVSINRQLIHTFLAEFDELTLFDAKNGKQALEMSLSKRPDLILMDRRLPDEDGDIICQKIKASAECANTPIIMITASVLTLSGQPKAYDIQLNKPLIKQELIHALSSFLNNTKKVESNTALETISATTPPINSSELIKSLKNYQQKISPMIQSEAWDINELIEIADQLMTLAKQHQYSALDEWANKLKRQAKLFDISAFPITLNEFENLLAELDNDL